MLKIPGGFSKAMSCNCKMTDDTSAVLVAVVKSSAPETGAGAARTGAAVTALSLIHI